MPDAFANTTPITRGAPRAKRSSICNVYPHNSFFTGRDDLLTCRISNYKREDYGSLAVIG